MISGSHEKHKKAQKACKPAGSSSFSCLLVFFVAIPKSALEVYLKETLYV